MFAHGSRFGGHALYIKDNRLHYVYNFVGMRRAERSSATEDVPVGENLILSAIFEKDGEDSARGRHRDPVALPRRAEGRRRPHQDPARQVLARRRGPVRRPRQRRAGHRRLPRRPSPTASPAERSTGSPSTSAASRTSTSSARPQRCCPASELTGEAAPVPLSCRWGSSSAACERSRAPRRAARRTSSSSIVRPSILALPIASRPMARILIAPAPTAIAPAASGPLRLVRASAAGLGRRATSAGLLLRVCTTSLRLGHHGALAEGSVAPGPSGACPARDAGPGRPSVPGPGAVAAPELCR